MNDDPDPAAGPVAAEPQNPDQHQSADATTFSPRRSRRKLVLVAGTCVALVIAAGTIVLVRAASARSTRRLQASQAAARFIRTWQAGDATALPAQTVTGATGVGQAYAFLDVALGISRNAGGTLNALPSTSTVTAGSPIHVKLGAPLGSGELISVPAAITIDVPGLGPWSVHTQFRVRAAGGQALINWVPANISPALKTGDQFRLTRTAPNRGKILGTGGQPLPLNANVSELVGALVPATAAQAKADPTLAVGELVGQSGLEKANDAALRGSASGELSVVDPTGHTVAILARWAGRAPQPVSSTVNPTMQAAAEHAISQTGHPSALVAIDTRTGAVLAAASNPAGYSRALLGQYPPGSTFKMVTLTAALMSERTLASPTSCSPTVTVDGYTMHNANGESFGSIPLLQAFAVSCNTSFINLAETLPTGALATAAKLMGCDTGHAPLTVPSFGCSYPAGATGTAYTATAIGQGTVLTSPLSIAAIAAAAASGTWNEPHVSPGASAVSHPLPAVVTIGLQQAMRAVVTSGTGTAANLPGTPVYGKTGTAEIGTGSNPPTDAWFAAFRGNVAVAVVVEDAGFGATAAVPVAASFLSSVTR
ncbi:MAG TPA: penicillin-binding transpeptidase domain-containing protein [Dermatophilaceae bacterium]